MSNTLPEQEALDFLQSVERGEVRLELKDGKPPEYYDVYVGYSSPCGWTLVVFNDVGEWDYLEWIKSPDGRKWKYADVPIEEYESPLQAYQPTDDVATAAYQWPW